MPIKVEAVGVALFVFPCRNGSGAGPEMTLPGRRVALQTPGFPVTIPNIRLDNGARLIFNTSHLFN